METIPVTWSPVEGAEAYQVMLYDRIAAESIFNETVPGTEASVSLSAEQQAHDIWIRVRALRGGDWDDWTDYRPLPLGVVLGERRDPPPPLSVDTDTALLLLFTVDTECSILRQPNPNPARVVDELIFGDFGNGRPPGGIGLHMDLLEHFGFRGCFFVDVLMEFEHGRGALERTVEAIIQRGHEVELHVHPEHLDWSSDPQIKAIARSSTESDRDAFRRLIELSVNLFERRVGRPPIAHRAGGYRITDMHFPILAEFGIRFDSSIQPYYNSHVSDWTRVRTQPFWVGGVLEIPPTLVLLNDHPDAWETRSFAPNPRLGDPISALPSQPGNPPYVATYVSHSFQLLRRTSTTDPEAVSQFVQRLRSTVDLDISERLITHPFTEVRTYGEEVDHYLVSPVAGILRRIADRPDARCVTYAALDKIAKQFWSTERRPPVDPIPVLDRRHGITRTTGTRVLSGAFLSHLIERERSSPPNAARGSDCWLEGLERCSPVDFFGRLDAAARLKPDEPLLLRLQTLGVFTTRRFRPLPPLAEVLFPHEDVCAVLEELGGRVDDILAWDATTFLSWFEARGFEIVYSRRVPRSSEELMAVDRFNDKLKWLDPEELRTEALEVELRYHQAEATMRQPVRPIIELHNCKSTDIAILPPRVDPELLPMESARLYDAMHPGQELQLKVPEHPMPASRTTCLLALLRAGLEVLDRDECGYKLMRPVELSDIRRFAGLD